MFRLNFNHHTILFIPPAIGFTHVGRLLLLAEHVRAHGHAVAFAYGGQHAQQIEAAGYPVYPFAALQLPPQTPFDAPILEQYTAPLMQQSVAELLHCIVCFQPDLIVSDFQPAARVASLGGYHRVGMLLARYHLTPASLHYCVERLLNGRFSHHAQQFQSQIIQNNAAQTGADCLLDWLNAQKTAKEKTYVPA